MWHASLCTNVYLDYCPLPLGKQDYEMSTNCAKNDNPSKNYSLFSHTLMDFHMAHGQKNIEVGAHMQPQQKCGQRSSRSYRRSLTLSGQDMHNWSLYSFHALRWIFMGLG